MNIQQIRSATIIINYADKRFLVDPMFAPKDAFPPIIDCFTPDLKWPLVDLPFSVEEILQNIDAVIMTHFHFDHFDEYAVNALNKDIKFFVQSQKDLEIIKSYGFKNLEIITEQGIDYKNIKLYKTNCQHGKREILKPLCESIGMPYDAMGVIFKFEKEKTLYIAGDTIWCSEVSEAIENFNPEIIVINACAATVLNGERLIMNIDDVKEVLQNAPNATVIGSHMDTVSHLSVTKNDLRV